MLQRDPLVGCHQPRQNALMRRWGAQFAAAAITIVLALGGQDAMAQQQLAPIPEGFASGWWHHGMNVTITRYGDDGTGGQALLQWREYVACREPSGKRNPPPCDSGIGSALQDGGVAVVGLFHVEGQDAGYLNGVVTATNDTKTFPFGSDVRFTMLPGHMLLMDVAGQSTMLCADDTDTSMYPTAPCGA